MYLCFHCLIISVYILQDIYYKVNNVWQYFFSYGIIVDPFLTLIIKISNVSFINLNVAFHVKIRWYVSLTPFERLILTNRMPSVEFTLHSSLFAGSAPPLSLSDRPKPRSFLLNHPDKGRQHGFPNTPIVFIMGKRSTPPCSTSTTN